MNLPTYTRLTFNDREDISRGNNNWCARRDLNPRHLGSKPSALSAELRAREMVRLKGLEPPTPSTGNWCSIL